jgi:hypothetical protein
MLNIRESILEEVKPLLIKQNIFLLDILYAFEVYLNFAFYDTNYLSDWNRSFGTMRAYHFGEQMSKYPGGTLCLLFTNNEIIIYHNKQKLLSNKTITRLDLKSILDFQFIIKIRGFGEIYLLKLDRSINLLLSNISSFRESNHEISEFILAIREENESYKNIVEEINNKLIFRRQNNTNIQASNSIDEKINSLFKLKKLLEDKVINQDEFERLKRELNL